MSLTSRRASDRVSLTVLLEASGTDAHGQEFHEPAKTVMVSQNGALIALARDLKPEQKIHIRRRAPAESSRQGHGAYRQSNGTGGRRLPLQPGDSGRGSGHVGRRLPGRSGKLGSSRQNAAGMHLLPPTRGRLPQRNGARRVRKQSGDRAALQEMQCAKHLGAGAKRGREEIIGARNKSAARIRDRGCAARKWRTTRAATVAAANATHGVHPPMLARTTNSPSARTFRRSACASAASGDSKQTRRSRWRFPIRRIRRTFSFPRAWCIRRNCRRLDCSDTERSIAEWDRERANEKARSSK